MWTTAPRCRHCCHHRQHLWVPVDPATRGTRTQAGRLGGRRRCRDCCPSRQHPRSRPTTQAPRPRRDCHPRTSAGGTTRCAAAWVARRHHAGRRRCHHAWGTGCRRRRLRHAAVRAGRRARTRRAKAPEAAVEGRRATARTRPRRHLPPPYGRQRVRVQAVASRHRPRHAARLAVQRQSPRTVTGRRCPAHPAWAQLQAATPGVPRRARRSRCRRPSARCCDCHEARRRCWAGLQLRSSSTSTSTVQ